MIRFPVMSRPTPSAVGTSTLLNVSIGIIAGNKAPPLHVSIQIASHRMSQSVAALCCAEWVLMITGSALGIDKIGARLLRPAILSA